MRKLLILFILLFSYTTYSQDLFSYVDSSYSYPLADAVWFSRGWEWDKHLENENDYSSNPERLLIKTRNRFIEKDYNEAIVYYLALLELGKEIKNFNSSYILTMIGRCKSRLKDYKGAIKYFNKALKELPDFDLRPGGKMYYSDTNISYGLRLKQTFIMTQVESAYAKLKLIDEGLYQLYEVCLEFAIVYNTSAPPFDTGSSEEYCDFAELIVKKYCR